MIDPALLPSALVPVAVGGAAALWARRASERLRPALATALLTALALTVSVVIGLLLCLAAVVALFEVMPALGLDHWSPTRLRHLVPIPLPLGLVTGVVAAALLGSTLLHLLRFARQLRRAGQAAAALPAMTGDLVVLEDNGLIAYAIPGRHRRIVVSVGLLRALTGAERRALLAHEAAHLRGRHHLYVQLGRLASAANPLVRPISRAIDLAVERWADDIAAREIGDRQVVARALAGAARLPVTAPTGALAAAETDVVTRVRVLLRPERPRWLVAVSFAAAIITCWASAALIIDQVHGLMELAESAASR